MIQEIIDRANVVKGENPYVLLLHFINGKEINVLVKDGYSLARKHEGLSPTMYMTDEEFRHTTFSSSNPIVINEDNLLYVEAI